MKKRILVLVTLVALFVLCLSSAAMAADDPITLNMDLSATRFSGPAEVTVTIRVTNTTDSDMPGPLALYYPDGHQIKDFGTPTLTAGQSKTWTGPWTVTADQIKAGKVIFAVRYSILGADGSVTTKTDSYYCAIEDAGAVAQVEINRYITPSMAGNGQKVSVIYEITNTGTIDVTDVTIKENSTISKTAGSIDLIKAGEKGSHTFTATMAKKDLTSKSTITYKAGGKTYTETLGSQKIKYGNIKLSATLTADKKGGNAGDTVKLTLTMKNTGKTAYENITVTDPSLGTVFSGLTVKGGETVTQEKEVTISKSVSYQFTVTGTASGSTVEAATGVVAITAVDPDKVIDLDVYAEVDKPTLYVLPTVVKFTVTVVNNSSVPAEKVTVSSSGLDLYTFDMIPAGGSRSFVRDVQIEMTGNYRFDARFANQLGETETFRSDLIRISHATPTAAPTVVPIATPAVPALEKVPTDDGLPPYVTTIQNVMGIGQWVALGIGVIALALIAVGIIGRIQNAAKSAKAPDHLERDGYRDYTQAVSSKHRHAMPEDEQDAVAYQPAAPIEAPVEESPAAEETAEAVTGAMAALYPETVQPVEEAVEATYTRRRKADEE